MPRRSSSSSGGNRSSARSASTSARQPAQAPPPVPHNAQSSVPAVQAPTSSGPGLFGQMASTAAGVAVGHTVGHGLSNMLFGGSSSKEETPAPAPVQQQTFEERRMGGQCDIPAKDFTRCLDATSGDISSCNYYLEQLKACQNMYQSHTQQSSF
ncbi:uncharacterized protein MELLADRAFT_70465 [Melampsora larici-populina 98AG31]|uniref:CHCH domain-containing protein n=1 Tax=Melampsora larici-populina (strain 98AG31 / pathotype 3-4-7) TaxID=747676 RepID=F4R428_MELLP|nr:uncharacterized protein MELLADRAFT_70465 [Melampsora larici-populina 98AG31]EGG13064.1 hypothetical protein MELLADRAFT_70465 [Melampsora larici-populina 98AG31]